MSNTRLPALLLALLAGCTTAYALPGDRADAITLRAMGAASLAPLLARWDAMPAGPARDALARTIDRVAGQRYATVSRLYWHTDLPSAQAAATAENKPILSLRMLGRLDEDLSCANSRLFRATLYANTEVSQFLRDNFILYWSSERDVPRVTIDFGDGRKIETTTTGNSAHYVLAADGSVLDVLPGLYAPSVFQAELTKSLALARSVARLATAARPAAIADYHRNAIAANTKTWSGVASLMYIEDHGMLLAKGQLASALEMAQLATVSKSYIEVPALSVISAGLDPGHLIDESTDQWAAIGQYAWKIGDAFPETKPAKTAKDELAVRASIARGLLPRVWWTRGKGIPGWRIPTIGMARPKVLDASSRTLVSALHDAGPLRAKEPEREHVIARLEHHIVADSALNQFRLRTEIHRHLAKHADRSFDSVNTFVYSKVFHTPRQDAWLGLVPRTDFTGLPGDGIVVP